MGNSLEQTRETREQTRETRTRQVLGQIVAAEAVATLKGYRAEAWSGETLLARAVTDGTGRFLLDVPAARGRDEVCLRVHAPWQSPASERTLSADELDGARELRVEAAPEAKEAASGRAVAGVTVEPSPASRSSQLFGEEEAARLADAVAAAIADGALAAHDAAWIDRELGELDALVVLARHALGGHPQRLEALREKLRAAPRWPRSGVAPAGDGARALPPVKPEALVILWAALALDGTAGEPAWCERAAGSLIARVAPLHTLLAESARLKPREWANRVRALATPSSNERALPARDEAIAAPLADWIAGLELFIASVAGALGTAPPLIGHVAPQTIRLGSTELITLLPPKGHQFPVEAPGFWRPALFHAAPAGSAADARTLPPLLQVVSWSPTAVKARLPPDADAGCMLVGWALPIKKHLDRVDARVAARCVPFLDGPGLIPWPSKNPSPVLVTVVGAPQVRSFHADGQTPSLVAEACAEVTLEWDVALELCHRSGAAVRASLWAGDAVVADVPLQGSHVVSERESVTYRLRAESWVEGECAGAAESRLEVRRYHAVQLGAPDRWFDRGARVPLTVRLSGAAPSGGARVELHTSNSQRLPAAAVEIPAGKSEVTVELQAGPECGEVTLAASAPGHQRAELPLIISDAPQVLSLSPPVVDAFTRATLCVVGHGLGREPAEHTVTLSCAGSSRVAAAARVEPNPADAYHGPTVVFVELPPLAPGEYSVAIGFRGRSGAASSKLLVLDQRPVIDAFAVSPPQIAAGSETRLALEWQVRHARRIRLLRGGAELRELTRTGDCAAWTGALADPEPQNETVEYTLEAWSASGNGAASRTILVPATSAWVRAREVLVQNRTHGPDTLSIWSLDLATRAPALVGRLAPGAELTLPLAAKHVHRLIAVSHALVDEWNSSHSERHDPTDWNTARNPRFERARACFLGGENSGRQPFTIFLGTAVGGQK
ncbi:MAG TPA: hypothetical protein VFF06_18850 [Polyangia bacterium]|nr:hypothetical protein [Polyangia bacterium]